MTEVLESPTGSHNGLSETGLKLIPQMTTKKERELLSFVATFKIRFDETKQIFTAADYSEEEDGFTQSYLLENLRNFWLPEEIALGNDLIKWGSMTDEERWTYKRVLGGLTLLDTIQGDVGMNTLANHVEGHSRKATLGFMGAMENAVHARSYSNIFLTLATKGEIRELFDWVKVQPNLQLKAAVVSHYYENIKEHDDVSLYKALCVSVFLESFLFYSGFYYPLRLAGQGKMMASGEIINLIIRDEAIHGMYVGELAQELFDKFDKETQWQLEQEVKDILSVLYANEVIYTQELYAEVGLVDNVVDFLEYNANKALALLGFDGIFEEKDIEQVIVNGLSVETKNHDFFSRKGNSYVKAKLESMTEEDFAKVFGLEHALDVYEKAVS